VSRLKRSVAFFFIRRSHMDSKKPNGPQAVKDPQSSSLSSLFP